ncbi:MAG TPA: hypothetical protein VKT73_10535 [Xanthobacteraceae bacterium]|nr:hypothetical protein [Xanthobacteraceae bacterium]
MSARLLRFAGLAGFGLLIGAGLIASVVTGDAQTGYGQIVLENHTSVTLDLYVDGRNSCRALSNLSCTTQEHVGFHQISAVASDGRNASNAVNLEQGQVVTWTISEQ